MNLECVITPWMDVFVVQVPGSNAPAFLCCSVLQLLPVPVGGNWIVNLEIDFQNCIFKTPLGNLLQLFEVSACAKPLPPPLHAHAFKFYHRA